MNGHRRYDYAVCQSSLNSMIQCFHELILSQSIDFPFCCMKTSPRLMHRLKPHHTARGLPHKTVAMGIPVFPGSSGMAARPRQNVTRDAISIAMLSIYKRPTMPNHSGLLKVLS